MNRCPQCEVAMLPPADNAGNRFVNFEYDSNHVIGGIRCLERQVTLARREISALKRFIREELGLGV